MKSIQYLVFSIIILLLLFSMVSVQQDLASEHELAKRGGSSRSSSHSSSSSSRSSSSSSHSSFSSSTKSGSKGGTSSSSQSTSSSSSRSPTSSSSSSTTTKGSSTSTTTKSTSSTSSSSSSSSHSTSSTSSSSTIKSTTKSTTKSNLKGTKTTIKFSNGHIYSQNRYYDPYYSHYYLYNYNRYYGQQGFNRTAQQIKQEKNTLSHNDNFIQTYLNQSNGANATLTLQNLQNIQSIANSSTSGSMSAKMQRKVNQRFQQLYQQMSGDNSMNMDQVIQAIQAQRQILKAQRDTAREAQGTNLELLDSQQSMIQADRQGRSLVSGYVNSTNKQTFFSEIDQQAQFIQRSDVSSATNNDIVSFSFNQAGTSGNFFQCDMNYNALNNGIIGNQNNIKLVYSVVDVNDYYSLSNLKKPVSHIYTMSAKYENNSDISVQGLNENQTVSIYIEVDDTIDCNYVFGYYINSNGNQVLQTNIWVEPNSTTNAYGKKACILHTTHFSEFGLMLISKIQKIQSLVIFLAMIFIYLIIQ